MPTNRHDGHDTVSHSWQLSRAPKNTVVYLWKKCPTRRTRTLYDTWKLQHQCPHKPTRKWNPPSTVDTPLSRRPQDAITKWVQYAKAKVTQTNPVVLQPHTPRIIVASKRDKFHARRLKLRKLQNILLLCR